MNNLNLKKNEDIKFDKNADFLMDSGLMDLYECIFKKIV